MLGWIHAHSFFLMQGPARGWNGKLDKMANDVGDVSGCVEGLLGVAIISGVALVATVVGSAIWKGVARKR